MTAAFVWWGVVVAGLAGYPLIAGIVYRKLGAPRLCRGRNRDGSGRLRCEGMFDVWGPCADCRAVRRSLWLAWCWPVCWITEIPRACFRVGADLTTTPLPNSKQSEPAEAIHERR